MAIQNGIPSEQPTIILAGATGDLGGRIAKSLRQRGANVRAIIRSGSANGEATALQQLGVSMVEVDFNNPSDLIKACKDGSCVVSALSGLHEVIVDVQTMLLQAAIEAGVPRFIPSDYAIDFTRLPKGTNRNLDLRQEFQERLNRAPIQATSVLNGMFMDLLTGQAPFILFDLKRVLYWEDADQLLDFTAIDNTAEFTAAAALDPSTPRYLRIAGETVSARQLKEIVNEVTGKKFRLFKAGRLKRLNTLIKVTRTVVPEKEEVFPPWQGMQYMYNMFSGIARLEPLDNNRYPDIQWTPIREVLAKRS
ncbi:NmrA family NAD(P)-binding protein [Rhodocytophaga rosea]|uniref:NmrA family NAD(P)-binding protein n=1 Tax=Rhodocytophaga rosea TaxID=2704465 RepID=A0A6C0GGD6_9BACT|nr:NmrA family NAD(P)-binding protein [Rhodocytophaga rosea]QHT66740.1 NmrA family NAD(P)-binding protein [Rhodocytophaga rosea]